MVQWLRIHLAMHGTQVRSLVGELRPPHDTRHCQKFFLIKISKIEKTLKCLYAMEKEPIEMVVRLQLTE